MESIKGWREMSQLSENNFDLRYLKDANKRFRGFCSSVRLCHSLPLGLLILPVCVSRVSPALDCSSCEPDMPWPMLQ